MSKKTNRQEYLRNYMQNYNQSEQGRQAQLKYNSSEKGRSTRKNYYQGQRSKLLNSSGCSGVFLLGILLVVGAVGYALTSGCTSHRLNESDLPVSHNNYNEEKTRVEVRSKQLGIRPVDYLHLVNRQKKDK